MQKMAWIASLVALLSLVLAKPSFSMPDSELTASAGYFHDTAGEVGSALEKILLLSEIDASLSINDIGNSDIRVFVVDVRKMLNDGLLGIGGIGAERLYLNVNIDRDGDIFIDRDLISTVFYNAAIDIFGLSESLSLTEEVSAGMMSLAEAQERSSIIGHSYDLLRLGIIRGAELQALERSHPRYLAAGPARAFGDVLLEMTLTFSLAPIFLHELGHYYDGTKGEFLASLIDKAIAGSVYRQEQRADDFALERLIVMFENFVRNSNTEAVLMMGQATSSTLKLLRDRVYFEAFDELRGLPAESYRANVYHKNCIDDPSIKQLPLSHHGRIMAVEVLRYPILTFDEYVSVRDGFLASLATGTHSHHFTRASKFAEVISSMTGMELNSLFDQGGVALDAFVLDEPMMLAPVHDAEGLGISLSNFQNYLVSGYTFEAGVNCPDGCWIGRAKRGASTIEVMGPEENISEIRMNLRIVPPSLASEEEIADYIWSTSAMYRVFLNVRGETDELTLDELTDFSESQIFEAVAVTRAIALECGVASFSFISDGLVHEVRSLTSTWFQIRFLKER